MLEHKKTFAKWDLHAGKMDQSHDDDDLIWMNFVGAVIGHNEANNDRNWWQKLWEMRVNISKVLPRQRRRASFRYFSICGSADSASEDVFMKPVDADKLIISFLLNFLVPLLPHFIETLSFMHSW